MTVATPIEVRQLGIALESARGTVPAAPTKFFSLTKESDIESAIKLLSDPALRGYNSRGVSFPGPISSKGPFKTPVRASDIYYWLKMVIGAPVSTELASFTVTTGVNDTIDFYDGSTDYHVTIAAGTYVAGQTHADTGSLCEKLYTGMHGALTTVNEVSFSRSTGLFTLTAASGTFTIKFATGTNTAKTIAPLIGFAVTDKTGADTYTGTVVKNPPFQHVFTQGQVIQLPTYAFYINRGLVSTSGYASKQYPMGSVEKLKISSNNESPLEMDATVIAQQEQDYTGAWSASYSESGVLMFNQTTIKVAGGTPAVPYTKNWSVDLSPGLGEFRPQSTFQYPYDILAPGPFMAEGDAVMYFMSDTERLKFMADTLTSLEFITVGAAIAGGGGGTNKYTLDLLFSNVEYKAFPYGDEDGFLASKVKWGSQSVSGSAVVVATVINTVIPGA